MSIQTLSMHRYYKVIKPINMVNALLVHTVSDKENAKPALCYWEPYGFLIKKVENAEHVSTKEKEILSFIMARVQTEYIFRKQVGNKEQSIETGIFKVSKNELFSSSLNVQWQACYGCAFVMLMSVSENVTLAEHVLAMIVGYATNIFNMVEEGYNQLIAYPDKMVALLHVFLPSGQLIFMNHRLVKQFEKDLDKILSEKK